MSLKQESTETLGNWWLYDKELREHLLEDLKTCPTNAQGKRCLVIVNDEIDAIENELLDRAAG